MKKMKRLFLMVSGLVLSTLYAIADVSDHGRWYAVEDDASGPPTGVSAIIMCVFGILLGLIALWFSYSIDDSDSKGCSTTIAWIGIIVCVIYMVMQCS